MLLMVFLAVIRAVVSGDPGRRGAGGPGRSADLLHRRGGAGRAHRGRGGGHRPGGRPDHASGPVGGADSFAHNWPALITNLQFVGGLGGVIFILGAFMVWLELIVRAGLVYLMVATAPLVLAMRIFPGFAPAWKKFAETAVAVILSKVFVAIALVLGLSLTTGGVIPTGTAAGTGEDIGQLIAGIAMMALAAFAPFVLLRFVPVVEAALLAQGISHMPARVAQQGMQASYYGQGLSRLAGQGARRPERPLGGRRRRRASRAEVRPRVAEPVGRAPPDHRGGAEWRKRRRWCGRPSPTKSGRRQAGRPEQARGRPRRATCILAELGPMRATARRPRVERVDAS